MADPHYTKLTRHFISAPEYVRIKQKKTLIKQFREIWGILGSKNL